MKKIITMCLMMFLVAACENPGTSSGNPSGEPNPNVAFVAGEYNVGLTSITFSSDCSADALLAHEDYFLSKLGSDFTRAEVQDIIDNGVDDPCPYFAWDVSVNDANALKVIDRTDADERFYKGIVASEGSFVLGNSTDDWESDFWRSFAGKFSQDSAGESTVSGTLRTKLESDEGNCLIEAHFSTANTCFE